MRFAIVGSGGLGCLFGGLLARAGADVTLIAHGANLAALCERGLDVALLGEAPATSPSGKPLARRSRTTRPSAP